MTNQFSKLVVDDPGFSAVPGQTIFQYTPNGGVNQQWFFSYNGNGYYTIQNASSGLYLADTGNGQLVQASPTNDATELWQLTPSNGGFVIHNKATGHVIDDPGFSQTAGTALILWTPNGGSNQTWNLQ